MKCTYIILTLNIFFYIIIKKGGNMKPKKYDDKIMIKLPKELKDAMDKKIEPIYMNRSEYIRKLIIQDLME